MRRGERTRDTHAKHLRNRANLRPRAKLKDTYDVTARGEAERGSRLLDK